MQSWRPAAGTAESGRRGASVGAALGGQKGVRPAWRNARCRCLLGRGAVGRRSSDIVVACEVRGNSKKMVWELRALDRNISMAYSLCDEETAGGMLYVLLWNVAADAETIVCEPIEAGRAGVVCVTWLGGRTCATSACALMRCTEWRRGFVGCAWRVSELQSGHVRRRLVELSATCAQRVGCGAPPRGGALLPHRVRGSHLARDGGASPVAHRPGARRLSTGAERGTAMLFQKRRALSLLKGGLGKRSPGAWRSPGGA